MRETLEVYGPDHFFGSTFEVLRKIKNTTKVQWTVDFRDVYYKQEEKWSDFRHKMAGFPGNYL